MVEGETVVAVEPSPFHQLVVTENAQGLRTLRFGFEGVRQSMVKPGDPAHLELAYTRVLPAGLAFGGGLERLLVIGLGAGTLPAYFHTQFPRLAVDVAEVDPGVLAVARAHFGFREDARLRVTIGDGRDFLEDGAGHYDALVLDCYGAEEIPAHLATLGFLGLARDALSPGGVVIANIWGRESNRDYDRMLATYRAAFPRLYLLDVPGPRTKVFIGVPAGREFQPAELLEEARRKFGAEGLRPEMRQALRSFRAAGPECARAAPVLRD